MAFWKVSTSEDQVRDGGSSNYIMKSGMYDVIIKHVLYSQGKGGSITIDLNFDYEGQNQTIWSAIRLTNNDGQPNFQQSLFNKLCIVVGANDGDEISDPVPVELPIGKSGEMRECMEIQEFQDSPVFMRVQMEYSKYDGKIQEKKIIKNFFRYADKASASEIVNNVNLGKQYDEELKLADSITYRDDLTAEDIEAWRKERLNQKAGNSSDMTTSKPFTRRTFGRAGND